MLQKVRIYVCCGAWQEYCMNGESEDFLKFIIFFLTILQAIKTTWKSSTVRVQLLPLSKRRDTFLLLLIESWTLLSFEMIFVSLTLERFFLFILNIKFLYIHIWSLCRGTPVHLASIHLIPFFPDLNLLDWSSRNVLAVALHNSVYLLDASQGDVTLLMKLEREEDYICSLSWTKEGTYLAIGTSDCKIQVSVLMNIPTLVHKDTWQSKNCFLFCF